MGTRKEKGYQIGNGIPDRAPSSQTTHIWPLLPILPLFLSVLTPCPHLTPAHIWTDPQHPNLAPVPIWPQPQPSIWPLLSSGPTHCPHDPFSCLALLPLSHYLAPAPIWPHPTYPIWPLLLSDSTPTPPSGLHSHLAPPPCPPYGLHSCLASSPAPMWPLQNWRLLNSFLGNGYDYWLIFSRLWVQIMLRISCLKKKKV